MTPSRGLRSAAGTHRLRRPASARPAVRSWRSVSRVMATIATTAATTKATSPATERKAADRASSRSAALSAVDLHSTAARIQRPHHQWSRGVTARSLQWSPSAGPLPRQMSFRICFGRTRLKRGMNQAPIAHPSVYRRPITPSARQVAVQAAGPCDQEPEGDGQQGELEQPRHAGPPVARVEVRQGHSVGIGLEKADELGGVDVRRGVEAGHDHGLRRAVRGRPWRACGLSGRDGWAIHGSRAGGGGGALPATTVGHTPAAAVRSVTVSVTVVGGSSGSADPGRG